jgi:3-phosphoshikimate 1-carboxyvinyltransferase
MARLIVRPSPGPLRGAVEFPSDKSISHRALIFASLASGPCSISGFSYGEDNVATLRAFGQMGVQSQDDLKGTLQVRGVGLDGLQEPTAPIDCGNSGTAMRLMAGLLAGQRFASRLVGDASLTGRPMGRVLDPLRARGAQVCGTPHPSRPNVVTAPVDIGPLDARERLAPFEYEMPIASAQVKSALLLSGLYATGPTVLVEPKASRDHTERMLRALGVPVQSDGLRVCLDPPTDRSCLPGFGVTLPGDLSAAAFALVAAQLVARSEVHAVRTGLNPTRTGVIDIIRAFGGRIETSGEGETLGEPYGSILSVAGGLRGTEVGGALAVRAIDEIPIAAVLAARAEGVTQFLDVGELRVKESDRIALTVDLLRRFGVEAEEQRDGFSVRGRPQGKLMATRADSGGDHRIAMCAAVLGLVADGETVVEDVDCISTSFPGFASTLSALGAEVTVQ